MTDKEINRRLALAIGYARRDVKTYGNGVVQVLWGENRRIFDFMEWQTIGPIAEQYNCFPHKCNLLNLSEWRYGVHIAETPQKAIALAVIAAYGGDCE